MAAADPRITRAQTQAETILDALSRFLTNREGESKIRPSLFTIPIGHLTRRLAHRRRVSGQRIIPPTSRFELGRLNPSEALYHYVLYYHPDTGTAPIEHALAHGAHADYRNSEAMILAASRGYYDIVRLLIESPSHPANPTANRYEALHAAAEGDYLNILAYLDSFVYEGDFLPGWSKQAFEIAAGRGYIDIVRYLVEGRPGEGKISIPEHGYRGLTLSCRNGHLAVVKYFLERDGNPAAPIVDIHQNGDAAIRYAMQGKHYGIVRYLLEKNGEKADIHVDEETILRSAAEDANLDFVRYLLEKDGEKADASDSGTFGVLYHAARVGSLDIIRYLLDEAPHPRANIHTGNDCALAIASARGYLEVVRYLLERDGERANVHAGNDESLFLAAQNGYVPVVRYLLSEAEVRADPTVADYAAFRNAFRNGQHEVVQYMIEHSVGREALGHLTQQERTLGMAHGPLRHYMESL